MAVATGTPPSSSPARISVPSGINPRPRSATARQELRIGLELVLVEVDLRHLAGPEDESSGQAARLLQAFCQFSSVHRIIMPNPSGGRLSGISAFIR